MIHIEQVSSMETILSEYVDWIPHSYSHFSGLEQHLPIAGQRFVPVSIFLNKIDFMWNHDMYQPGKQASHFLTLNTVDCVDIFIRPVYKQVIVHTLNHFIDSKGLVVFSWCLMTNHLHLLVQPQDGYSMEEIEFEYKAFTTQKILAAI